MRSDGQRYTRVPLGARGNATCSMVQSCQVNWQITIPKNSLALQLNVRASPEVTIDAPAIARARARVNFNILDNPQADWPRTMQIGAGDAMQPLSGDERIMFWIEYSTACGPFQQIAICKDNIKLWETSIYAREYAMIAANLLSDQCINNSVSVTQLESVGRGRRHCGIFNNIPVSKFGNVTNAFNYILLDDITIAGVLDLNQLNPIFSTFPVLARNFASQYLQLWTQDFFQDLKIIATDDSFIRGYNSSKMSAITNIQITLKGNLNSGIVDADQIKLTPVENQNNLIQFVATRSFSTPTHAQISPQILYLCDATVRFTFIDALDPQVLNFEIICEIGGTMVRNV
ncbi:MAG: hypothetical protein EZS28_012813 [Streblomastix strix]|uniref:Uncharacterized protein n=1 Tax=Streblomastix strix TaxID=222440 RepID=A0A5J4WA20_9EUKA|nr:MAG: hypothetical protein EZS28_012813 [Streblomastix strix]